MGAAAPVICNNSILPLVVFAVGVFGGSHTAVLEHTFHHSTVLIGKADDNGLAAAGHMTEGQRPHMAGNDALFLFGDMEHLFRIDAGTTRVGEAVHLEQAAQAVEGAALVPVVEVEVVEEGPHGQRCLVRTQMTGRKKPKGINASTLPKIFKNTARQPRMFLYKRKRRISLKRVRL